MKDNTYICIQSFMRKDLGLKGNALMVYAVIYGFSQDGEGWFTGSKTYLADWLGITTQSVLNVLHELVDKGLIEVRERPINGVNFKDYRATSILPPVKNFYGEGVKNLYEGGQKFLPHNINHNIASDNNSFVAPSYEQIEAYCKEKGYQIDIAYFMSYYATGKDGKWIDRDGKPVKNWKQRVVTWASRSTSKRALPQSVKNDKANWQRDESGGFAL